VHVLAIFYFCVSGKEIVEQCGDVDAIMLDMIKIDAKAIQANLSLRCR